MCIFYVYSLLKGVYIKIYFVGRCIFFGVYWVQAGIPSAAPLTRKPPPKIPEKNFQKKKDKIPLSKSYKKEIQNSHFREIVLGKAL